MCKKIILKRIVLRNFKSLSLDVTFNSEATKISGENGIGKSSLQSAWNWLLTSYTNSVSPKNHELFDNRSELTHETPVASVKVWITIDGTDYTIEKTAQAKFTRKRGTNEYVKESSDAYKTYVDEIEVSSNDFANWISGNICDSNMLSFCLDGSFFTTLAEDDKKKARKVLETIVGEIKDSDFVGDYTLLIDDLKKGYSVEQIEERVRNTMKPTRKRMAEIPALIRDKEEMLADYQQYNFDGIKMQIESNKKEIEDIDNQMLGKAEALQPILQKRNELLEEINSKTLKISEHRNIYHSHINAVRNEIKGKINDISERNQMIQQRNQAKQQENDRQRELLARLRNDLSVYEANRAELLKRRDEVKSRLFVADKCAYCGQELPMDMIDEMRNQFNAQKKSDLDMIVSSGKMYKQKIDECKDTIEMLTEKISKGIELEELEKSEILQEQLKAFDASFQPFEETNEYKALKQECDELRKHLPEIPQNNNQALTERKKSILSALDTLNRLYGRKSKADELKAEIDGLKSELQQLGVDVAKLEGKLAKCSEYREEKADIISFRVNDKLTDCKIQMWERQKNGEMIPSCIVTDNDGVKYSTLNNSNRIKTCVRVQQLFCRHYGIELPVWVDEASIFSSKNQITIDKGQIIYLYATDSPNLCVE